MANPQEMTAAAMAQQLQNAVKVVEEQVDEELKKLENMDDDEMEKIRFKRMQEMKMARDKKDKWLSLGHGTLSELSDERDFFTTCKQSKRVVCHFYASDSFRSKLIDKHMNMLASRHLETKFVKVDHSKVPFLVDRLNIRVKPTLALVKDGKTESYIRGNDPAFGEKDDFSCATLEAMLGKYKIINYTAPEEKKSGKGVGILGRPVKQNLRGKNESDSDDDW